MDFPFADAPSIIRANQKDAYIENELLTKIKDVLQHVKGVRFIHKWGPQVSAASTLLYLGLTTLLGSRTLGEEYTDIFYLTPQRQLPSKLRLALYVLTSSLGPLIVAKLVSKLRERLGRNNNFDDDDEPSWLEENLTPATVVSINLAVFYFSGAYYQLTKRLFGLRYAFGYRVDPLTQPTGSYELLGVLMIVRAIGKIISSLKDRIPEAHKENELEDVTEMGPSLEDPEVLPFIKDDSRSCNLCLQEIRAPTVTLCGHLFCWSCISEWCRDQAECPLCRQECHEQHLLCLRI